MTMRRKSNTTDGPPPAASEDRIYVTAAVSGRVQGVGFRYYTAAQAQRLGVRGWVRNERDGSVTVVCEGKRAAVRAMLDWLKEGPPSARVDHVDARESEYRGQFRSFSIEY